MLTTAQETTPMNKPQPPHEPISEELYRALKKIAHRQLVRMRPGHTLATTALVHESYLKILHGRGFDNLDWSTFLGLAATCMRQIIVDEIRRKATLKRGGLARFLDSDVGELANPDPFQLVLALNDALETLRSIHPPLAKVVECRYFAGFSEPETAQTLGTPLRTVQRHWMRAKAWLAREIPNFLPDSLPKSVVPTSHCPI